jgi:hypothetical protein
MKEQANPLIFYEEAYKSYLAVGFTEEEAERMATQPEEANIEEAKAERKGGIVRGFAKWDYTKEGFDYWNNLYEALVKEGK